MNIGLSTVSLYGGNDFVLLCPELFVITAACILLIYGVVYSTSSAYKYPLLLVNIGWLSVLCLVCACALHFNAPVYNAVVMYNTLVLDECTFFLKTLVIVGALASFMLSFDYFVREKMNAFEYAVLMLLSTGSMLLMISSYDLISMYLTIELQSLCFYVLAASKRNSEFATEAGLKYFILGAFSSGILLFGSSMVYGFTGTTNFEHLAHLATASNGVLLGMVFLAVGFLFKLTAAPFHMWAPDVYEGAPTAITAFFAIVPKVAILGVFLRLFLSSFYDLLVPWQSLLLVCSLLSMLVGSLAALSQKKLKRLLAFSSVGHIGYMLMGMACGTVEGIQALLIYICIYVLMSINVFACVLSLRGEEGRVKYISDIAVLSKTNPILAITLALTMFSMAGIPPLAGFCSKFYIFFAAISSSLYVLAFVGVMTSCISCFYYIRMIKIMYFEKPVRWLVYSQVDKTTSLILGTTLVCIVFFFVWPSPLFVSTHNVALALCS